MATYETRRSVFISAQYAERPNPNTNKDIIDSVPMSPANKAKFDILKEGDPSPFEFVQEVKFGEKYPATDGDIYAKEWAESYVEKANAMPLPGSKDGHTALRAWKERVENHLYVLAAKIDGDSLFIRHYVSNQMPTESYQKLIKEIKAGMISTSVMGQFRFEALTDVNKNITGWKAIESVGAERNDLVEWDQAGMSSKMIATSQKADIIRGEEGEHVMGYKESVEALKAIIAENGTSPSKVIADLGLGVDIATDAMKASVTAFDGMKTKVGGDPVAFIESTLSAQKQSFETLRDAALASEFKGNDDAKALASDIFAIKSGSQKDIIAEIERIKGLPSVQKIAQKSADGLGHGVSGSASASGDLPNEIVIGRSK